ncbi:(d)CMP kinase [Eubacteriales bacterium OttesenSCG-928-G02]|nr:(d)CMP kinase [Eubacteriales bacterium OttesenSCG-928-G02]
MKKIINIAIDGPSGSGKSTLAKALARHYGLIYIDTGALYRTIGLYIQSKGFESTDTDNIIKTLPEINITMELIDGGGVVYLNGNKVGDEIRTPKSSIYASDVSKIPEVRAFLLDIQRNITKEHSCIMDGRDIGTVIIPNADVKIFLSAKNEDRAMRRYQELLEKNQQVKYEDVLSDIIWRDENDKNRNIAPAVPADDAYILDNSGYTCEQTFNEAKKIIETTVRF